MDRTKSTRTNSVLDRLAWKGAWLPRCTAELEKTSQSLRSLHISSDLLRSPINIIKRENLLSLKVSWVIFDPSLGDWTASEWSFPPETPLERTTRTATLAMTWCRDMPSLQESDNPKGPTCWATSWRNASRQKPLASFKAAVTAVSTQIQFSPRPD